jgi:hypothetical protein
MSKRCKATGSAQYIALGTELRSRRTGEGWEDRKGLGSKGKNRRESQAKFKECRRHTAEARVQKPLSSSLCVLCVCLVPSLLCHLVVDWADILPIAERCVSTSI